VYSCFFCVHLTYISKLSELFCYSLSNSRRVSYEEVRLPPTGNMKCDLYVDDEVEVFTRDDDSEPCGWWPARIVLKKGEFYVIQYSGWDATFNEIVPRERIRPLNRK